MDVLTWEAMLEIAMLAELCTDDEETDDIEDMADDCMEDS
jgi:hypothetical protein